MTIHDRLVKGLLAMGATPLPKRNKYTMLQLNDQIFFVGSAGALRYCKRMNAAMSVPCHEEFRQRVLNSYIVPVRGAMTSASELI